MVPNVRVIAILSHPEIAEIDDRTLSIGQVQLGRFSFEEFFGEQPVGHVFTLGGASLQHAVRTAAEKHGFVCHAGLTYEKQPIKPASVLEGSPNPAHRKRAARVSASIQLADEW